MEDKTSIIADEKPFISTWEQIEAMLKGLIEG